MQPGDELAPQPPPPVQSLVAAEGQANVSDASEAFPILKVTDNGLVDKMKKSGFGYFEHLKPSEFHLGMHVICSDKNHSSMSSVGYVCQFSPCLKVMKLGCLHPWSYEHAHPVNSVGYSPFC